ncbi:hypothetical protein [Sporisorium scitamineum]|nr:hypothetical protein [Sporisorium scitamineum]
MEKGGGKGQWSAWKAAEMSKRYEAKGGDYQDTGENPNEPKKGTPAPKKKAVESGQRKGPSQPVGAPKTKRKSDAETDDGDKDQAKDAKPKKPKTTKEEPKPATKGTRQQPKRGVKK